MRTDLCCLMRLGRSRQCLCRVSQVTTGLLDRFVVSQFPAKDFERLILIPRSLSKVSETRLWCVRGMDRFPVFWLVVVLQFILFPLTVGRFWNQYRDAPASHRRPAYVGGCGAGPVLQWVGKSLDQ